jgi:membrane-associated phospholipid phosphatase
MTMFQTEIHLWLQSFDSPFLRLFMQAVSFFGDEDFYTLLVVVLLFGIDKKRGFIVMQVMLWISIVTAAMKDYFALPRPVDVDRLVADLQNERKYDTPFVGRDGATFFGLPPGDVVSYFRNLPGVSYGFPSGHCSSSIATWGSLALLFRRAWLVWVTLAFFFLMPVSRMYLGRHFLADVIGGMILGLIAVTIVAVMQRKWMVAGVFTWGPEAEHLSEDLPQHVLEDVSEHAPEHKQEHEQSEAVGRSPLATWKGALFLFVLPVLPMVLSESAGPNAAILLGLNAGYMLTGELRALEGNRTAVQRILTVLLAAIITGLLIICLNEINSHLRLLLTRALTLTQQTVIGALVVVLTYWLARFLHLESSSSRSA